MDLGFEVFWYTFPSIEEEKSISPITIDIVSIYSDTSKNIGSLYVHSYLFLDLSFCRREYIFICFFFPSRKSPVMWPVT